MGKLIDTGNRDHWTVYPKRLEQLRTAVAKQGGSGRGGLLGYATHGKWRDPKTDSVRRATPRRSRSRSWRPPSG